MKSARARGGALPGRLKVLLINPGQKAFFGALGGRRRVYMTPLSLATVAALTPEDVTVHIWDEGVHGLIDEKTAFREDYDLIGVTGFENHLERVQALTPVLRSRGVPLAVGGPGVSAAPELYRDLFDHLFIGEAEYTWRRFLDDWRSGSAQKEYRQIGPIDMADSPLPRWDEVDLGSYIVGAVQTTRGCPFDCEFCDVIYIYGRQPRHKPTEQVLEEIVALERRGAKGIFLCDDNFIGTPSYGKALLKELVALNQTFRQPLWFVTQISLNVAKDKEFLSLLADANFDGLYVGVETPNREALVEANKPQNYRADIVQDVKTIQSYGLPITAGMIVGFDHDDPSIFEQQFEFLQEVGIVNPHINVLKALKGTKLWVRLLKERRVTETPELRPEGIETVGPLTNIVPKRMSRVELLSGYRELLVRIRAWPQFEERVRRFVSNIQYRAQRKRAPVPWTTRWRALKLLLFDMDREARGAALRLLRYTRRVAPSATGTVTRLIGLQYFITLQLPKVLNAIDNQLAAEKRQEFPRAQTVFFIPEKFERPYRDLFPDLVAHARSGLIDESRVKDVLFEATYDFLTRWGPTFDEFGAHHRAFLFELCDRTVAQYNAATDGTRPPSQQESQPPDDDSESNQRLAAMQMRRLADAVLHSVQQDLRTLSA